MVISGPLAAVDLTDLDNFASGFPHDLFAVQGEGGNRLWLVPSLQIAILRTAPAGRDADWDDTRIPNLIIRGARDYLPPAPAGVDVSTLVPAHKP